MLTAHVALVSQTDAIDPADLSTVSAALQKQVTRDFGPLWDVDATVDSFPTLDDVPVDYWPVIVSDTIDQPGALGYHKDENGQPLALVMLTDSWPLTVSHEVLEMLADPFGNRTVAGSPPPQATGAPSQLDRVTYLVEVCDPCEADSNAYDVNGVTLSDFITGNYYDPMQSAGVRYSFQGGIKKPHEVLKGGYVSFGDPLTNEWYQVVVDSNGRAQTIDLGMINARSGASLREAVDEMVRRTRKGYRKGKGRGKLKKPAAHMSAARKARADTLRKFIASLQ